MWNIVLRNILFVLTSRTLHNNVYTVDKQYLAPLSELLMSVLGLAASPKAGNESGLPRLSTFKKSVCLAVSLYRIALNFLCRSARLPDNTFLRSVATILRYLFLFEGFQLSRSTMLTLRSASVPSQLEFKSTSSRIF